MPGLVEGLYWWVVTGGVGLVGLVATAVALAEWNEFRKIALTRTTAPGAVDPSAGVAEVAGRVEVAGETVTAPLTGTECVGYVLHEEVARGGLRARLGDWIDGRTGGAFVPFYLADGDGRVLVRPGGRDRLPREPGPWHGVPPDDLFADLELAPDERRVVDDDGPDLPAAAEAALSGDDGRPEGARRRYTEWHVAAGDDLYVIGSVGANDDEAFDATAVVADDGGTFVLSETPQWRTAGRRLVRAGAFTLVAASMLAYLGSRLALL